MTKHLLHKLIRMDKINLTTGLGTGLIPLHTLIKGGYWRYAKRRMLRAITHPGLAWRLSKQARAYRARISRSYTGMRG